MKGVLFLCVANSARSQIAEGIARSMVPEGVKVFSAGSKPSSVRPEAIAVMLEIGIDISSQRSKPVEEIPAHEVGTVVTLCAEEVCPAFFGNARRLRWELPDPISAGDTYDERLESFRKIRDELVKRIRELIAAA